MRFLTRILIGMEAVVFLKRVISIATIGSESYSHALTSVVYASRIPVVALTILIPATPSTNNGGSDPAIIVALIGVGGVIIGALITGGVVIYQTRRTRQLQQEQLRI